MKNLSALIAIFLLPLLLSADEIKTLKLSLPDALAIGDSSSYMIKLAEAQLAEAKGNDLAAWQTMLPAASISANYLHSTDPVSVFGMKLKQGVFNQSDFAIDALNSPDAFENYTTQFQVSIPLINIDAFYGKSAAQAMVKARGESLVRARQTLNFQIKSAYYALILSRESIQTVDDAIRTAEAHRDNALAAFEQGMISRADYLSAEVRLSELAEQRIVAVNQMLAVTDGLKFLLGISDENFSIIPRDTLSLPATQFAPIDMEKKLANRADLQALHFQEKAAIQALRGSRASWLPRLNAFGINEWNSSKPFRNDASNWTVGVRLSWNIFNGLARLGNVRQQTARVQQMKTQYHQHLHQARNEITAAKRDVDAARQRIFAAQTAIKQARESLSITNERFQEGLEKSADLLAKQAALTHARLRFLKARHDYHVARDFLLYATGDQS